MLTVAHAREMMVQSLRSPADLADRLGLTPTPNQLDILDRFAAGEEPMELTNERAEHTVRAVALCALWRLLLVPGSSCTVISSDEGLAAEFMGFLHNITTKIDPTLTSICKWPRWSHLEVGSVAGYELRLVSNVPGWLGTPDGVATFVILGAASNDPDFTATREVVEGHVPAEDVRLISIW